LSDAKGKALDEARSERRKYKGNWTQEVGNKMLVRIQMRMEAQYKTQRDLFEEKTQIVLQHFKNRQR